MNDNVQLKINVINQLQLLRMSTFKDKLCFLDEDIQNAQRAKAKNFKVVTDYFNKKIVIENDGENLEDPQCLFSIAESGWNDDVKKNENPFGTGFFSNISVSNNLEIYSGDKHIIFDVDKMIQTKDTNIFVEQIDQEYKGFKLILNNFNFSDISTYDIEERVKLLGKYVHELNVYYNDDLIDKKDLLEGDNSIFQIKIEEDSFKGWLALQNGWYYDSKINIYYKGRLICNLENMPYIKGDIHVNDATLNLTAPDRKNIIKDNKFNDFVILLKLYIEKMCNEAFLEGKESDIQECIDGINYYINKNKLKRVVKFVTFKSSEEKDMEYLKGISSAKMNNPDIKNFQEYVLYLEKEKVKVNFQEIETNISLQNLPEPAKGEIFHKGYTEHYNSSIEKPEIKQEELEEQRGNLLFVDKDEPTFWLSFDDIVKNERKLNVAKHYNLKIIVARNKIEEEILKDLKASDNILHISELKEEVIITANLYNTKLNIEEQRALMILNMISTQILKQDKNLFQIGDLIVTKNIQVASIQEKNEIIEDKVRIVADQNNKMIYIDRSTLNKNHLISNLNEELNLDDYKFILANLNNMCNEIELLNIGKTEAQIKDIIINTLGGAI